MKVYFNTNHKMVVPNDLLPLAGMDVRVIKQVVSKAAEAAEDEFFRYLAEDFEHDFIKDNQNITIVFEGDIKRWEVGGDLYCGKVYEEYKGKPCATPHDAVKSAIENGGEEWISSALCWGAQVALEGALEVFNNHINEFNDGLQEEQE